MEVADGITGTEPEIMHCVYKKLTFAHVFLFTSHSQQNKPDAAHDTVFMPVFWKTQVTVNVLIIELNKSAKPLNYIFVTNTG